MYLLHKSGKQHSQCASGRRTSFNEGIGGKGVTKHIEGSLPYKRAIWANVVVTSLSEFRLYSYNDEYNLYYIRQRVIY